MKLRGVPVAAAVAIVAASGGASDVSPEAGRGGAFVSAVPHYLGTQEIDGEELYDRECASCHGNQGRGNGRGGRDLDPRPNDISDPEYLDAVDDAKMIEAIAEGVGDMGGIAGEYDQGQIRAIVDYVRELGERRRR